MAKRSETVEAILGLVIATPVVLFFGYGLVAGSCSPIFHPPNSPGCVGISGSDFLGIIGLVSLALALTVVGASLSVLIDTKRRDEKP